MTTHLQIDFVSDIACPWCVVGLRALDMALAKVAGDITADIHFQPFELNPDMGPDGQDITEHITEKYGISVEQANANRENIRKRGAELGFTFTKSDEPGGGRNRAYNTFDAHRLLHWAEVEDAEARAEGSLGAADVGTTQKALKHALFKAYFTDGKNLSNYKELVKVANDVGLDPERALEILKSDTFAAQVREREQFFQRHGINSVPAIIINQKHLISGGQPPEVFEQALRQIAAQGAKV